MNDEEHIRRFLDDFYAKIAHDLREGASRAADGKWQGEVRQFPKWIIAWVLNFLETGLDWSEAIGLEAGLDKPEDLYLFETTGKTWRTEKGWGLWVDNNPPSKELTFVGFDMAAPNPDPTTYTTFYAGAWWKLR